VFLTFVVLTTAVGCAVIMNGGDDPGPTSASLLLVAVAAFGGSFSRRVPVGPDRDRVITLAALLFPAYVAFQLVPLPLSVIHALSPARAELARGLQAVGAGTFFTPVTISSPTTWMHLLRVTGYTLTFLTVRRFAARSPIDGWYAALPLIGVGTMEAAWALAGNSVAAGQMSGTYYSKNHFAGLLEMTLPFTAVFAWVMLGRGRTRHGISTGAAIGASVLLAGAVATFIAITSSLSKGGALATFTSLLAMGMLASGRHLSGHTRLAAFGGLLATTLLLFVFVTPTRLVEQFAVVVSDDQTEGRLPIWQNTVRLIAAYPFIGVGLGNFYPGVLPYQTEGNAVAWVHAHNDYLQLLAELGIIGWLLPVGVAAVALVRAVRAALGAPTRDGRLLGLASGGALIALAAHSLADFNTYVISNALVLAWIAGIASTLSLGHPARDVGPGMPPADPHRAVKLALAVFLMLWTGAWLVFLQKYRRDPEAEGMFCRFGICDTVGALALLHGHRSGDPVAPPPPALVLNYVRRDPAEPSLWQDLGVAYQAAERIDLARFCFTHAATLAPHSPPILLMTADFHLDVGEETTALALVSRALADGEHFDAAVFADLAYYKVDAARVVVGGALPDRRAAQAYLRYLMSASQPEDAKVAWRWMVSRGYADDAMGREYFAFLLGKNRGEEAAQDWELFVRGRDVDYPEKNRVFNGGFESNPSGSPFDWRFGATPGVNVDRDSGVHYAGASSLRLRLDGTANSGELGVEQLTYLRAGRYRMTAVVKTDSVSTDQGIAIRMAAVGPGKLDVRTVPLRGSNDWTPVEQEFVVDADQILRVSVVRKPSLKFDNLVHGTAWVDQIGIAAVQ
jgi:O-antigen ligase